MNVQKKILPTFVNVGPGRCATSWMHEMLNAHPEIGMAKIKETEYFNTNIQKGLPWYLEHFSHQKDKMAIGEISNNYYLDTTIPRKLLSLNPNIKVIFCIRKPHSLLESYFQFGLRRALNFSGTISDLQTPIGKVMGSGYQSRKKQGKLVESDKPTLLQSVMLSYYASHYIDHIPQNQLHFFIFEKFKKSPENALKELYEFLEVDSSFRPMTLSTRVNEAIIPKSKLLARTASKTAFILRKIGAYGLLSKLHQSTFIKKIVFNPANNEGSKKTIRLALDNNIEKELESEQKRIEQMLETFNNDKVSLS